MTTATQLLFVNFGDAETDYCLPILAQVRAAGIRAEVYPDAVKVKKQMQYANAKGIPFVAMAGETEMQQGKITLKDMATGEQACIDAYELIDRLRR